MDKVTLDQALQELASNAELAQQQPEKQKAFEAEYMYADPNDYDAMKELYESYGYTYSRSLWSLQQLSYRNADTQATDKS